MIDDQDLQVVDVVGLGGLVSYFEAQHTISVRPSPQPVDVPRLEQWSDAVREGFSFENRGAGAIGIERWA